MNIYFDDLKQIILARFKKETGCDDGISFEIKTENNIKFLEVYFTNKIYKNKDLELKIYFNDKLKEFREVVMGHAHGKTPEEFVNHYFSLVYA